MQQYAKLLIGNELFRGLSAVEIERLIDLDACAAKRYAKNQLVVQEYDPCDSIGLLLDGSLALQRLSPGGEVKTIQALAAGNCFGEGLLFAAKAQYPFNIVTTANALVLSLPFVRVRKMLADCTVFCTNYLALLSNRLVLLTGEIQVLAHKNARARLSIYLASESRKSGKLSFILQHNRTEIAEWIGMERPSVSRELSRMQREGIIAIERNKITILKPEILALYQG